LKEELLGKFHINQAQIQHLLARLELQIKFYFLVELVRQLGQINLH
jgi:hypothetical protein